MKPATYDVQDHAVVSHDGWIEARRTLLAKEKEFTRLRDQLSQERRDLPWERVDKQYTFEGPAGRLSLADVFSGSHQLVVYHFMFDPSWDAGCKSCSFWADNFNGIPAHLRARDVSFAAISRAPLPQIEAYRKRMGWSFLWLSSFANDFNRDFNVTFTQEELDQDRGYYNYTIQSPPDSEGAGLSVFYRNDTGAVYHTYSAFSRGIDIVNGAYNFLDLVPKGRDEREGIQRWIRRHDEYGA
jgi:predicted dithiol-disulfide oxidoreductase (DUF899 family)